MTGNIMIAGSSDESSKIIKQVISKLDNINVHEAYKKSDIVENIRTKDFHVCIFDIRILNEEAYNFLEEILKESQSKNILTIICSEDRRKESIERSLKMGIYEYFCKPFDDMDLTVKLPLKVKTAICLMRKQKSTDYLSHHDELTGLYNRRFFDTELCRLDTERQLPISIIFGDVNGLKIANDAFGHDTGDEILKSLAAILKNSCRDEDIVARWGGDEFVILLPQTCRKAARKICERIKSSCKSEEDTSFKPSISLGYDTKEFSPDSIMSTLKNAEDWMYIHKTFESRKYNVSVINSLFKIKLLANNTTKPEAK